MATHANDAESSATRKLEGAGTSADLDQMLNRIEADTLKFAKHFENLLLFDNKCSYENLEACSKGNYDGCESELPSADCAGGQFAIDVCGKGEEGGCGGLMDFTSSRITLAPSITEKAYFEGLSDRTKDGICLSRQSEEYIINDRSNGREYWDSFGVESPRYLFGSDDGVFRILPGNLKECPSGVDNYDPVVRDWYVAASSGPKDVILILDTSGSMNTAGRMQLMKDAAKRVVSTLGVTDFFSVIRFSDGASYTIGGVGTQTGDSILLRATKENKDKALKGIDRLVAGGSTNFYDGFHLAYETLEASMLREVSSQCHQAILFLTDGGMTQDTYTKEDLYDLIETKNNEISAKGKMPPVPFTYSFGSGADREIPHDIACKYDGIWNKIRDGDNLAKSMGGYYKYFAYGLGGEENKNFVAWVAPYLFASGNGYGTTASAPVYDRSVEPPVLEGVVGLDLSFKAMEKALSVEGEAAIEQAIKKMVERSIASCPNLEITPCRLESLRFYSQDEEGSFDALCESCSEAPKSLTSALCTDALLDYPSDVYANKLNSGRPYTLRACCGIGEPPRIAGALTYDEIKDLQCKEAGPPLAIILGSVFGGLLGLILGVVAIIFIRRKCKKKPQAPTNNWNSSAQETPTPPAPEEPALRPVEFPSPYVYNPRPPATAPTWEPEGATYNEAK